MVLNIINGLLNINDIKYHSSNHVNKNDNSVHWDLNLKQKPDNYLILRNKKSAVAYWRISSH
jgi:hypothetical protein